METNDNVRLIRGEPEKAIRKLALPMILSMLIMASYNLIDGMWVAGLGGAALAAIGYVMPLFMIMNGITNGLAVGINSLISRYIGAKNKENADSAAVHSILLLIIASILTTATMLIFQEPLLGLMGAEGTSKVIALQYSTIIFLGAFAFMFSNGASGILRGEGDVKRATYIMAISSILNIILDPIFIYILGFGIAGAGIATVLSSSLGAFVIIYWIIIKKDTYVDIYMRKFKFDLNILVNILKVGIPVAIEMMAMASASFIFISIISFIGGFTGVAVFTSGQRLVMFTIVPLLAISSTIVTVVGSAYGAHNGEYIDRAHSYGIKLGIIVGFAMTLIFLVFANQLAFIFSYTPETAYLQGPIATFLQITSIGFIFIPLGMTSNNFYQGIGRGLTSLFFTILREIILVVPFVYIMVFVFEFGLIGVWVGIILGRSIAAIINLIFARYTIRNIKRKFEND